MDLLSGCACAMAVVCLGLATAPSPRGTTRRSPRGRLVERMVARSGQRLRAARLQVDPALFTMVCVAAPPVLLLVGLVLFSPVMGVLGCAVGLAVPRLYLDALVRTQHRRTEAEAPRLLQVIVASLAAGRTYLEAFEEARRRVSDRWLRDDLDHIIGQFHLDVPLERSIADVRAAAVGRNLGLVWDNLAIAIANHIPANRAKGLLVELSSTVQFNVQLQQEVRARTAGQRAQIWLLAAIVPGLFFYLRLINPDFFTVLDSTLVGRYLLLPAAVALEVAGVLLSLRVSRVEI